MLVNRLYINYTLYISEKRHSIFPTKGPCHIGQLHVEERKSILFSHPEPNNSKQIKHFNTKPGSWSLLEEKVRHLLELISTGRVSETTSSTGIETNHLLLTSETQNYTVAGQAKAQWFTQSCITSTPLYIFGFFSYFPFLFVLFSFPPLSHAPFLFPFVYFSETGSSYVNTQWVTCMGDHCRLDSCVLE